MSTAVIRYWRHIVRSGRWAEALASLTALRDHLRRDPPPIDYQLRRIIADEPSRLAGAIHEAGFDASNVDRHDLHDVVRRFWEHFTGGDLRILARAHHTFGGLTERWTDMFAAVLP